jgi:glycosyltransferase involved in cell wall biosynthesis
MLDAQRWATTGSTTRVGVISTYPPTRCGIARFTSSLCGVMSSEQPHLEFDVVRLVNDSAPGPGSTGVVQMEIDPSSPLSIRAAAHHLNRCDIAIINHEFGIFGPNYGSSVGDLVRLIDIPTISVLHTVLAEPAEGQRRILEDLAELTKPVVLCESARRLLVGRYSVPESSVEVIHHGAHWSAQPVNNPPRRQLITWGLLGPGKGLERSIAAVAQLRDLDPPVHYRIVGRTHPNVVRNAGFVYRYSLQRLIEKLGVDDLVEFVDRYVDDDELFEMVRDADVVVVPYDNRDQVSSGVMTESIGLGRPVVATRFFYAEELLGTGAGLVVDHDPTAMASAIRILLDDSVVYRRAAREATAISSQLSWSEVGKKYSELLRRLASVEATA